MTMYPSSDQRLIRKSLTSVYLLRINTHTPALLGLPGPTSWPVLLTYQLHTLSTVIAQGGLPKLMASTCLKHLLRTKQLVLENFETHWIG